MRNRSRISYIHNDSLKACISYSRGCRPVKEAHEENQRAEKDELQGPPVADEIDNSRQQHQSNGVGKQDHCRAKC